MNEKQILDCLQCSYGTFATITGLRTSNQVGDFRNWMFDNLEHLEWKGNAMATIKAAFVACKADFAVSRGMSVQESKKYLENRGLESMVPGGFATIQKMQQARSK